MARRLLEQASRTLAMALFLAVPPAYASRVIEVSNELSFGQPAMNAGGSVAYFAYTDDFDDEISLDGLSLKRNGSEVLASFGQFLAIEYFNGLDISNSGLLGFVGAHRVVGNQVFSGTFRGASPAQPDVDEFGRYSAVFMQGSTVFASRVGPFVDVETAYDQIFCSRIRLTSNRLLACESNQRLGVQKLYDEGRGVGASNGKLSENGQFLVSAFQRAGQPPGFALSRFNNDSEIQRFERVDEYADAVGGQFSGTTIRDWLVSNSGVTAVLAASESDPQAISLYKISQGGGVSLVQSDIGGFPNLIGISSGGTVIYAASGELYSSADPSQPWATDGHAIEDYKIQILRSPGTNGYSNGQVATTASLCRLDDRQDCYSAVIVLDGSTTAAPPPPDPNTPPPDLVVWNAPGTAAFNDASSWDPAMVPDSSQIALFAGNNDLVSVDFGNNVANTGQLRIEQGTVNFQGGGYQLNQGSVATPSFLIEAGAPGDLPTLFIDDGHQFSTTHAAIRNNANASGLPVSVFLEDSLDDPPIRSRWDNLGRITVDGYLGIGRSGGLVTDSIYIGDQPGSIGTVAVGTLLECPDISIADFGSTWVGYQGRGTLEISGTFCAVEMTGNVVVGALPGSQGTVEVTGTSWIPFYTVVQPDDVFMVVGRDGAGVVNVTQGGAMGAGGLSIGQNPSGTGELNLSGFVPSLGARSIVEVENLLAVGSEGTGTLRIDSGARLTAAQLDIGGLNGRAFVAGAPDPLINVGTMDIEGTITVAHSGQGLAEFSDLALVNSSDGLIGDLPGSAGRVIIRDGAAWDLANDLKVGNVNDGVDPSLCAGTNLGFATGELILLGDGVLADIVGQTLTITGPDSSISGTGRSVFVTTTLTHCATLAPGTSPGTLTIEGNLTIDGGILDIEIDGLTQGQFDVLTVDGDVDLGGATVRFSFGDHVPTQGDQIRFLSATGTITSDETTQWTYVGAEPGFEFQITPEVDGGLTFTALNDAFREQVFGNGFEEQ